LLLKPYLALRSDWGQFEKGFDTGDVEEVETKGLKNRLGRLSVMKELEALRAEGMKLGEGITSLNMPSIPASLTSGFSISTRLSS
jgi:exocyst complex component 5